LRSIPGMHLDAQKKIMSNIKLNREIRNCVSLNTHIDYCKMLSSNGDGKHNEKYLNTRSMYINIKKKDTD